VLLAHLVEPASLGLYAFGASLAAYLVYVGYAVFPLLLTRASQLHDVGDLPGLRRLFATQQRLMFAAYIAALGVALPFAREGVVLLAGREFEPAAEPFVALALAVCVDRVFGVYQYVFHLVKRPFWIFRLALLNATMMTAAVVYAATTHGIGAVPWALLLATLLFNTVRFAITRRYLPLPWPTVPAAGLAAILVAGWLATPVVWSWPLAAKVAVACIACCAALTLVNAVLDGRLVIAFRNLIARAGLRNR
jgi:O-antigen/teichoic acid export membrane protein